MTPTPALKEMPREKLPEVATKSALTQLSQKRAEPTRSRLASYSVAESSYRPQSISMRPQSQQPTNHAEVHVLRRSVQLLTEQNCTLKSEMMCSQLVCQQLMRKIKELRQAMLLQNKMLY